MLLPDSIVAEIQTMLSTHPDPGARELLERLRVHINGRNIAIRENRGRDPERHVVRSDDDR